MARWREKRDPRRVANWLGRLRLKTRDEFILVRTAAGANHGERVRIAEWPGWGAKAPEEESIREFAEDVLAAAQEATDDKGTRCEFALVVLRKDVEHLEYELRCAPSDETPQEAAFDSSTDGQIRQQMMHAEASHRLLMRSQHATTETLMEMVDMLRRRVTELETERALLLDVIEERRAEESEEREPGVIDSVVKDTIKTVAPHIMTRLLQQPDDTYKAV